jgi:uncharacterized protein (TIRG00374 family)
MRPTVKHFLVLLGLVLSVLFLWLALRNVDGEALWQALRSSNPLWIVPFLLSLAAFCWLKAVRWALLLTPTRTTRASELLAPVIIGYMGTGLMPMQLGEIARAYLAATRLGTRVATILASLVVERILDIFSLLVIIALVGVFGTELSVQYRVVGLVFAAMALTACVALWLYARHTDKFIASVQRSLSFLPPALTHRIVDQLRAGSAGVQILRQPSRYAQLAGLSLLQWSFMCACTWISLAAIGQFTPPVAALAVLATTIVSMTLPSSPGYIGALQLAYVLALAPFGIERSDAVAASFVYLAALWVPLVACGMLLLHRMGLKLRNVKEAAG